MSDEKENPGNAPPELLIDGSFEKAVVGANTWSHQAVVGGWRSDTEIETWGKGFYGLKAADGDKLVELDYDTRASNIYQDVKTEAGTEYTFKFDYMKRPDSKAGSDTIQVWWNGKMVGVVDPAKSDWSTASFKVVGTGGTDRIEFREDSADNDSYGGLIDNASLKRSGPTAAERAEAAKEAAEAQAKADAEAKARAEAEAKEKAAAEAKAKADADAKAKAEQEAKTKAEQDAKDKAEKEAKEKAEHEAKDKAEKEAKEKAEHEAKDKAEKEAKEKAEHEAKDKAEKEAKEKAEHEAKEKAEKEAKEKAEHEAKDKAEKDHKHHAGNDDDKHDGRGHHGHHGHDVDTPPVDPAPKPSLSLKTADSAASDDMSKVVGSKKGEAIVGDTGHDWLVGKGGDDKLVGATAGHVTLPLDIEVSLTGVSADSVLVDIAGLPSSAKLSVGTLMPDGTWEVRVGDLANLSVTLDRGLALDLKVSAHTVDGSNLSDAGVIHLTTPPATGNLIEGGAGNDVIHAGDSGDVIYGGSHPTGASNPAHVSTVADNDIIFGGAGNDTIYGQTGDDEIHSGGGKNYISGGKGNDAIFAGTGYDEVHGNSGDDVIYTGTGSGKLFGESGNDKFVVAGAGSYEVSGGSGFDTLDFSAAKAGVNVDMSKGTADGYGSTTFKSIESVVGSDFADQLKGSNKADVIDGGAGDDVIRGLGGADKLTGGAGKDTFAWLAKDVVDANGKSLGVDVVTDFSKEDVLDFSKMFKSGSYKSIEDVVQVKDDGTSSHVFAAVDGAWHEVVVLEGVTGVTAASLHHDGMLLV